ncbi:MAG: hypothetical protein CMP74_03025 [Flavobacteriales bacterium]|nr:hypothetical protein [Flavobacteriales bacterium]
MQISRYQSIFIIFLSAIFIFFSSYMLIEDKGWIIFFPLTMYFLFSLFEIKKILWIIVFLSPLSVPINELGFFFDGINFTFPTEILLFGLLFVLIIQIFLFPNRFTNIFNHKITFFLILYLLWMLVTCITSTSPIVSFKLFLTRLWFIIPFYFFSIILFQKKDNIFKFILIYTIPLCIVVIYTLTQQSGDLFDSKLANGAVYPFFNDHTSYGAILAFFIPSIFIFMTNRKIAKKYDIILIVIFIILLVGLFFSYTRAAWLSFIIALFFGLFIKWRLNFKHFISLFILFFGLVYVFQDKLISSEESSNSFLTHFQSSSNISTDASNMERINRWNCAIKMFNEKPIYGFGPGTYQFEYSSFQDPDDKTIISTKFGDGGNAHSEYLSALSETGIFGLITFLMLIGIVFFKGIGLYYNLECSESRVYVLCSLVALMTYFIHALFNNFLDIDKVSIALWSYIAIIVSVDLRFKKENLNIDSF